METDEKQSVFYAKKFQGDKYVNELIDADTILIITPNGREIEITSDGNGTVRVRGVVGALSIRPELANSIRIGVVPLGE